MQSKPKLVSGFIIGTFVTLYLLVSVISTIHVIDFFKLSNPTWLAISLAVAFEVGAAASLASLIALKKMNKSLVWMLFFLLTAMQAMGNTYYAYVNLVDFTAWSELFGLIEEDIIFQKRILSIVSGAILPIVALGFIKSLVDYIKPEDENTQEKNEEEPATSLLVDGGGSLTRVKSNESNESSQEEVLAQQEDVIEGAPEPLERIHEILLSEGSENISEENEIQNGQEEKISHNGAEIVINGDQNQRRVLHRIVETPGSAVDPTKL